VVILAIVSESRATRKLTSEPSNFSVADHPPSYEDSRILVLWRFLASDRIKCSS